MIRQLCIWRTTCFDAYRDLSHSVRSLRPKKWNVISSEKVLEHFCKLLFIKEVPHAAFIWRQQLRLAISSPTNKTVIFPELVELYFISLTSHLSLYRSFMFGNARKSGRNRILLDRIEMGFISSGHPKYVTE